MEEIEKHSTPEDLWLVVDGDVFDMTKCALCTALGTRSLGTLPPARLFRPRRSSGALPLCGRPQCLDWALAPSKPCFPFRVAGTTHCTRGTPAPPSS